MYKTTAVYVTMLRAGPEKYEATRGFRTFGTWTMLGCVLRVYAAYDIQNRGLYDVTLWSFAIGSLYFGMEWAVFGGSMPGRKRGLLIAMGSCIWMALQRHHYLS